MRRTSKRTSPASLHAYLRKVGPIPISRYEPHTAPCYPFLDETATPRAMHGIALERERERERKMGFQSAVPSPAHPLTYENEAMRITLKQRPCVRIGLHLDEAWLYRQVVPHRCFPPGHVLPRFKVLVVVRKPLVQLPCRHWAVLLRYIIWYNMVLKHTFISLDNTT